MSSRNIQTQIVKNSFFNLLGFVFPLAVNLFTIPFFVSKLQEEAYGVFVLIGSVTGYFALVQIGIGPAITKFVSEYKAKNDYNKIHGILNLSFVYLGIAGSIVGLVIFALSPYLPDLFKVSMSIKATSVSAFQLSGIFFAFSLLSNVFPASFDGMQRFDLSNQFTVGRSTLSVLLNCVLLALGFGLKGIVIGSLSVNFLSIPIGFWILKRSLPSYSFSFAGIKENSFIFKNFGLYAFISQLSKLFTSRLPEIIIGIALGPSFVTYYSIPKNLIAFFASGTSSISSVLFPLASEMKALGDEEKLRSSYIKSSKFFIMLCMPFYFVFIFFSKNILGFWLGDSAIDYGWLVMTITAITYLISAVTVVPSHYLLGYGKVKFIANFSIAITVISAIMIYPLTLSLGVVGAALAVLITQVSGIVFVIYSHKILRISNHKFSREFLLVVLTSVVIGIPFIVIDLLLGEKNQSRFMQVITPGIYVLTYFCICFFWPSMIDLSTRNTLLRSFLSIFYHPEKQSVERH